MSKSIRTARLSVVVDLIDKPETNRIVCHGKEFVRVVRCKDCKYCEKMPIIDLTVWRCSKHSVPTEVDYYCSWGERKDEIEN